MFLPTLNAVLNSVALCLLIAGLVAIKSRNRKLHAYLMGSAFIVSTAFLTSYLIYHLCYPVRVFQAPPLVRTIYLSILIPHVVLAALVPPLAIITLYAAVRRKFQLHKKMAKVTLPIWIFVSASGIVVYLLLYVLY